MSMWINIPGHLFLALPSLFLVTNVLPSISSQIAWNINNLWPHGRWGWDWTREWFLFTETESKRIHVEYQNINLEISAYDYHKDVTEIIRMSVSKKKKSFFIWLFKKCIIDKYIWPVEKYIPYWTRLHYMSIKDLTDKVKICINLLWRSSILSGPKWSLKRGSF